MLTMKLLIFSIIVLWLYILWTRRKYYKLMLKIPGPSGYPFIGVALEVRNRKTFLKTFEGFHKNYGNIFLSWLGTSPFMVVNHPQFVQDLLTSPYCVNRSFVVDTLGGLLGYGLFSSREPIWSRHRKLLNPSFNNKVLTSFFPIFNEESEKLLKIMDVYCECQEVNPFDILKTWTFSLTTRTMFDRDLLTAKTNDDLHVAELYEYVMAYTIEVELSPWLKPDIIQKILRIYPEKKDCKKQINEFIRGLIEKKIEARNTLQAKAPSSNENNFINLALKLVEKGDFTQKDVEDQAHVMLSAGFETSNNAVAYTLIFLSMFPEYQEKLFEEILTLYPNLGNFDVSLADAQQMVYMDMVINEVMRIGAPVPVLFREISGDIKLSNGLIVPKGVQVCLDLFNMQRRKDIWGPDADMFNPDHFLPSNLEDVHSYAFLPFAKGLRNCIGWRYALLSMKIVLANLIRNYQFTTEFKFEDLEFMTDITLKLNVVPKIKVFRRTT